MDFDMTNNPDEQDQPNQTPPPPVPGPGPSSPRYEYIPVAPPAPEAPRKKSRFSILRVLWGVITILSILANLFLLVGIIVLGAAVVGGNAGGIGSFSQTVLREGDATKVIAVIDIDDVIDFKMSDRVRRQLEAAAKDVNVRAVIIRIVSPGGYVSSSDQIYYEINRFEQETGKKTVAFMQTVAASGGYYSAVACEKIIAEPTVITGSIGVIMNHLVLQELLEEKLGINPVVIKSGPHKDWPSSFSPVTDEQREYLMDKLIQPSYERFIGAIAEGRGEVLTEYEIRKLADGSIYYADEALEKKLIDQMGYLDDAIALTEKTAGISGAQVVEYQERFSILQTLVAESKTNLKVDQSTLHKLAAPELMYLWDGRR